MPKKIRNPKNFLPHILSLLTAIALWIFVSSINQSVIHTTGNISIRNLPSNLQVKELGAKEVECSLRGSKEALSESLMTKIHFYIDLKNAQPGSAEFEVHLDTTSYVNPNVTVLSIKPPKIRVHLEEIQTDTTQKE